MIKKNTPDPKKLIEYYNFINYNLIYNNKAINRYKKDNFQISPDQAENLERLKKSINSIRNCSLKNNATNMVFSDGNPKSKIMLSEKLQGLMRMKKVCHLWVEPEHCLIKCLLQSI